MQTTGNAPEEVHDDISPDEVWESPAPPGSAPAPALFTGAEEVALEIMLGAPWALANQREMAKALAETQDMLALDPGSEIPARNLALLKRASLHRGFQTPSFELHSLSDAIHNFDLNQPYLVKGLFGPGELGAIYGPSTGGKTAVAIPLCLSLALGNEWNERRVTESPVLYVCTEGQGGFSKRLAAYAKHHDAYDQLRSARFSYITDAPNLQTEHDIERLFATVQDFSLQYSAPGVIVFDTLARMFGGEDENASGPMGRFIDACNQLQRKTGATIILIHHTGKDTERGLRGHSSLKAALDFSLEIRVDQAGNRAVRLDKVKDGKDGLEYPFELKEVTLGMDDEGDWVTSIVAAEGGNSPIKKTSNALARGSKAAQAWSLLSTLVSSSGDTEGDTRDKEIRVTFRAIRSALVEKKVLVEEEGVNGMKLNDSSRQIISRIRKELVKRDYIRTDEDFWYVNSEKL